MKFHFKIIITSLLSLYILNGCATSSNQPNIRYVYPDENYGDKRDYEQNTFKTDDVFYLSRKSQDFQNGFKNGCSTAKGNYKKNRILFKENKEYNNGWFFGLSQCRT